jgi:hypothetical protein
MKKHALVHVLLAAFMWFLVFCFWEYICCLFFLFFVDSTHENYREIAENAAVGTFVCTYAHIPQSVVRM